jgi:hypothetical protein
MVIVMSKPADAQTDLRHGNFCHRIRIDPEP